MLNRESLEISENAHWSRNCIGIPRNRQPNDILST